MLGGAMAEWYIALLVREQLANTLSSQVSPLVGQS